MATNYLFYDGTAGGLGTLAVSKFVTQTPVYEAHIPDSEDWTTCLGIGCFQVSQSVVVLLAITSAVAAHYLVNHTHHIYI